MICIIYCRDHQSTPFLVTKFYNVLGIRMAKLSCESEDDSFLKDFFQQFKTTFNFV